MGRLLHDRGYLTGEKFFLRTSAEDMLCHVNGSEITVALGVPKFKPSDVPFISEFEQPTYKLEVNGDNIQFSALYIGNPHAVILVEDVETAPVAKTGPQIESHPRFPERTNVGYLQVVSKSVARLRVFERGVGETFACGSGAGAAVVAGIRLGLLDHSVEVKLTAGSLFVEWQGSDRPVHLSGPASYVYEGRWNST
ncbi:MAG: diaminopimelate epimerase [Gammaproteobacteria bacterium]|nr:diaminopimelate epimerase [Gammaproteobacteria bacterium]